MMRWVQHAAIRPHKCAAIPFIGNSNAKRGFIDLGTDFREQDHAYVSIEAVEHMAKMIGWAPPGQAAMLTAQINQRDGEIARLQNEVAEAARFREAAEYTLQSMNVDVQNKPRRAKEKV